MTWGPQGRCAGCGRYVERVLAAGYGDGRVWCQGCADKTMDTKGLPQMVDLPDVARLGRALDGLGAALGRMEAERNARIAELGRSIARACTPDLAALAAALDPLRRLRPILSDPTDDDEEEPTA